MISNAARRTLEEMKAAEDRDDLDDAEIVCEGRVCYVGLRTISKATVNELHRLVLISGDQLFAGAITERYGLNEEGRAMVKDPNYKPKILEFVT